MIYLVALAVHVLAVVLGLGQVLAIAIAARSTTPDAALLGKLARTTSASLGLVLLSGIAMVWVTNGVYAHALWLRASLVCFLAIGALAGLTRRAVRAQAFSRVRALSLGMTALVGVVVVLMEAKP